MRKVYFLFAIILIGAMWSWAQDQLSIENIEITPHVEANILDVKLTLCNSGDKAVSAKVALSVGSAKAQAHNCSLQPGQQQVEYEYKMPAGTKQWSEFSPECYSLNVVISSANSPKQLRTAPFAMREITREGSHVRLNGKPVFLRSSAISCHFPPDDVPPENEAAWAKIFHTAKSWGLNSLCFHGWQPSDVAVKVANRMGLLLISDADSLMAINGRAIYPDLDSLPSQSRMWMLSSGATAVEHYKRWIERAMLCDTLAGFELVGLQDCPVEGKQYVGLLDELWDSKGIVAPLRWRQWCAPVTVLAQYDKDVYSNGENFYAAVKVANYGPDTIRSKQVKWEIVNAKDGSPLASGQMRQRDLPCGQLTPVGEINAQLLSIVQPVETEVRVWIDHTEVRNTWPLWVFPYLTQERLDREAQGVMLTRDLEQAIAWLDEGHKVLYSPEATDLGSKAVNPAEALGLICNQDHPALAQFPTQFYGDWQWEPLFADGAALDVTNMPEVHPIVWLIDDYHKNRRLSPIFELRCGSGSLIVSTIPLWGDTLYNPHHPDQAQLLLSILNYMKSDAFAPEGTLPPDGLATLISGQD